MDVSAFRRLELLVHFCRLDNKAWSFNHLLFLIDRTRPINEPLAHLIQEASPSSNLLPPNFIAIMNNVSRPLE